MKVSVIIPVLNEAESIGLVLDAIPKKDVQEIVIVDNGSSDRSVDITRSKGAKVVHEPRKGYGRACLTGLRTLDRPEVVVFLDGDFSDDPGELPKLLAPIERQEADFVLGSRMLGEWERGSIQQEVILRNKVACFLIRFFFRGHYTDIGPFRAIRSSALEALKMRSVSHGWNIEMQIKAAKKRIRTMEIPVRYRHRIGQSKFGGNSRGSVAVTFRIFRTLFRHLF